MPTRKQSKAEGVRTFQHKNVKLLTFKHELFDPKFMVKEFGDEQFWGWNVMIQISCNPWNILKLISNNLLLNSTGRKLHATFGQKVQISISFWVWFVHRLCLIQVVFCNVRTYNSGCGDGRGKLRFLRLLETLNINCVVVHWTVSG